MKEQICAYCREAFVPPRSSRRYCSRKCYLKDLRDPFRKPISLADSIDSILYNSPNTQLTETVAPETLPEVSRLPAEYLKQCYDYWRSLVGEDKKGSIRVA